jgi:hypothetical protein
VNSADESLRFPRPQRPPRTALIGRATSPRFAVYLACAAAAVVANYLLGKDMMWDTLDYHLYAGFSALHDRFGQDYFAAGPQSYFNPYLYVPFYLLARSGLPALVSTSILAIVQSAVLWLTYEMALAVASPETPARRSAIGVCTVVLAFANPILIAELGSSYSDITTAELVLAGWLLLLRAVGSPGTAAILCAGLVLGGVSALKLTNAAHALAAFVLLLFPPITWRARIRYAAVFALALGAGFLLIAAPWAIRLQHHFGNPLFPLLNDVFRSRQYSTGLTLDYRFIPDSLADALWRPFAIVAPVGMVDNEFPSPDLRYAVLLILGLVALIHWVGQRLRAAGPGAGADPMARSPGTRMLAALGCGFLVDWLLWLKASGNGRYFIAMACVAAVLAVALAFRLLAGRPKLRNYLLGAVLCAQVVQLTMGAGYRIHVPWDGGPWFEVTVPKPLAAAPRLYFLFGNPSNAFLASFLPPGSGFINIGGGYELDSAGANGRRIQSLIRGYEPHLRVVTVDSRRGAGRLPGPPDLTLVNDELARFGLRADPGDCSRIVLGDTVPTETFLAAPSAHAETGSPSHTSYLATCHVVLSPTAQAAFRDGERSADTIFDRLEDACPALFRPRHLQTRNFSDTSVQVWAREYSGTGLTVYVGSGRRVVVRAMDRGGPPEDLGSEREWLQAPPRVRCGRRDERYWVKVSAWGY